MTARAPAPALQPILAHGVAPSGPAVVSLAEAMARSREDRERRPFVQGALALDLFPHRQSAPEAVGRADTPAGPLVDDPADGKAEVRAQDRAQDRAHDEAGSTISEEVASGIDPFFAPQPTSSAHLPDPREVAASLGLAIAEISAGLRSPSQVLRWTTPEVYAVLAQRAATAARRAATPAGRVMPRPVLRLLRVHICRPADGVAEAAVVLRDGPRTRAMALRLVGVDGRWRVAVLQIA